MRALIAALGLVVACRSEPRTPVHQQGPVDPSLLRTLAVLATRHEPSTDAIARARHEIDAGTLTVGRYIDNLVATDAFATEVAPLLIVRQFLNQEAIGAPLGRVLSRTDGEHPAYYRWQPCKPDAAVDVHPWWALVEGRDDTVRVCPDSYRPERWAADVPRGEPELACVSIYGMDNSVGPQCGCGPNLIRCYPSQEALSALRESMRVEVRNTVAHVVANDLPLETIFTANETHRDRNAEVQRLAYTAENARQPVPEAALTALASWPADGKWAPRDDLAPGQNAGILTSPQIVHYTLDRRQRMTAIDDVLWCIDPDSIGASPETLLSITGGADLQIKSQGWKELAARPICTNCHARLDYGFQFFWGYPNGNLQAYFVPALQQSGRGPLYVHDIDDRRGDAELNPQGFASLAVKQPEFRRCMARDFVEYVLGNQATTAQVAAADAGIRPGKTTARDLMRVALGMLAAQWQPGMQVATPVTRAGSQDRGGGPIAVTPALRAQLDRDCMDCHDHEVGRPDFSVARLERTVLVDALESVSSGRMPKSEPMLRPARSTFLDGFIAAAFTGADAQLARSYYLNRFASMTAYRPEVTFSLIHGVAGASSPTPWRMMENAVRSGVQQLTPGFATVSGLEAIESCRARFTKRADLDRCIDDALQLGNLTGEKTIQR